MSWSNKNLAIFGMVKAGSKNCNTNEQVSKVRKVLDDNSSFSEVLSLRFIVFGGWIGCRQCITFQKPSESRNAPGSTSAKDDDDACSAGFIFLVILWATGIPLTLRVYGSFDLGWPFHLKMFGATILLAAVAFLNFHLTTRARAGSPPSPRVMKMTPPVARTSLVLVLIGVAVLTTSA